MAVTINSPVGPVEFDPNLFCPLSKRTFKSHIEEHFSHPVPRCYVLALARGEDGNFFFADAASLVISRKTYEKVHCFYLKAKEAQICHLTSFTNEPIVGPTAAVIVATSTATSLPVITARISLLLYRILPDEQSLVICQRMLADDPQSAVALFEMGDILRAQNNLEQAEECLCKSIQIKPCASAYGSLGMLYDKKGDTVSAWKCFSKALELDSTKESIQQAFEKFIQKEAALIQLKTELGQCSDEFSIHLALGAIYSQSNQLKNAAEHAQAAHKLCPENGVYYALAGNIARKSIGCDDARYERIHAAKELFKKAIALGVCTSFVLSRLADIYRIKQDDDRAYELSQNAVQINPSDVFAHNLIFQIATKKRMYTVAETAARKLCELKPNWSAAHEMLADTLLKGRDERNEAEMHYQKAIDLDHSNAQASAKLAKILNEKAEEASVGHYLV